MENEIELKLIASPQFAQFLSQEISNFTILTQKNVFLSNCYYDTPDQFFAKNKMGLRVRQQDNTFTLTLKTNGTVQSGLHIRPEYNVPLNDAHPDLNQLAQVYPLENVQSLSLTALFSTDFQRQSWLIECGNGTQIEVALDQGEIIAQNKTAPICEVEFELKQGNIADLLYFVNELSFACDARLSQRSKAQRGYQLALNQSITPQNWLTKWREFLDFAKSAVNSTQKLTALIKLEQEMIEETVDLGADYFAQDFIRSVERIGAFFNLYYFYSENAKLLEQCAAEQAEQTPIRFDEQRLTELLESNVRLLDEIKEIIRLHSESKNNLRAMNCLISLLQSGRYVKRMLNFLLLTVK